LGDGGIGSERRTTAFHVGGVVLGWVGWARRVR
jgi:hypothetical protein